jgi:hypothetical protein
MSFQGGSGATALLGIHLVPRQEQQDGRASVPTSRFNHCRAALLFTLASTAGQGEKNNTATPQTKRHQHALLVEIIEVGGTTSRSRRRSRRQVDPHLELLEI